MNKRKKIEANVYIECENDIHYITLNFGDYEISIYAPETSEEGLWVQHVLEQQNVVAYNTAISHAYAEQGTLLRLIYQLPMHHIVERAGLESKLEEVDNEIERLEKIAPCDYDEYQ